MFKTQQLDDVSIPAFLSSNDLFAFFKTSLNRCVKLSNRKPMIDLSRVFTKYLNRYVEHLNSKLPREENRIVSEPELVAICRALNTAVYVGNTAGQVEERVKKLVDQTMVDRIDFKREIDILSKYEEQRQGIMILFNLYLGSMDVEILQVLVKQMMNVCDQAFQSMAKPPYYGTLADVRKQKAERIDIHTPLSQ